MRFLLLFALCACGLREEARSTAPAPADTWAAARHRMVREQIEDRGVSDVRVLEAMRAVPRHEFVPSGVRALAYGDHALPIGHEQTISQPYIVALMGELAELGPRERVLEIGSGSGYGAAVLARVAGEVYTIEILEPLAKRAEAVLARLGFDNVTVRHGDGYRGWPEAAPFDAIVVTAAPPRIPEPLKEQLKVGGHLVIPVGERYQEIRVLTRTKAGFLEQPILPVRFVPMTGEVRKPRK